METKGESLTIKNKSEIIELAVKANRLDDAKTLVLELVQSGGYPLPRVFRFFMKSLAAVGDHHSIKAIGQYLDEVKRLQSHLRLENLYKLTFTFVLGKEESIELRKYSRICYLSRSSFR